MGGYAGCIGDYCLIVPDYVFDYVKDGQSRDYYDNYQIDCEFVQYLPGLKKENPFVVEKNKNEWNIQIPLSKFGEIKKLRKNYRFHLDFNLNSLLWSEIKKREIIIKGYIGIGGYYENENGKNVWSYYYLMSKIGEKPIKLQSDADDIVEHELKDYEDHKWIIKHGLEFFNKKGK